MLETRRDSDFPLLGSPVTPLIVNYFPTSSAGGFPDFPSSILFQHLQIAEGLSSLLLLLLLDQVYLKTFPATSFETHSKSQSSCTRTIMSAGAGTYACSRLREAEDVAGALCFRRNEVEVEPACWRRGRRRGSGAGQCSAWQF